MQVKGPDYPGELADVCRVIDEKGLDIAQMKGHSFVGEEGANFCRHHFWLKLQEEAEEVASMSARSQHEGKPVSGNEFVIRQAELDQILARMKPKLEEVRSLIEKLDRHTVKIRLPGSGSGEGA